ncbi:MAG: penicillin-binding protein activator [Gammaproteobacteria bacterium]|nr:penicillin-binding protein activator [Gammaproteobacteria bacterium]
MHYFVHIALPLLLAASLLINGCSSTLAPPDAPNQAQSIQDQASKLLNDARNSPPALAEQYMLDAAELLLHNWQVKESLAIINNLDRSSLSQASQYRYLLLYSEAHILLGNSEEALDALTGADYNISALTASLSIKKQLAVDQLRARAYQASGKHLEAARERIFFNALLSQTDSRSNEEKIWSNLLSAPLFDIQNLPLQRASFELNGWIQLALVSRENTYDIDAQKRALDYWLKTWPSHPAAKNLPLRLKAMSRLEEFRPQHIALLLPLSNQLSGPASAIRNGFLANYYLSKSRGNPSPILRIYNTERPDKSFMDIYLEASQSGADLIVGPLKKVNVTELENMRALPLKTLSLNYGSRTDDHTQKGLTQFGLSPEDETKQIALKAFSDGHDRAAILYPDNQWGYRLAQSFSTQWRSIGGKVLIQEGFPVKNNYGSSLKTLLNIPQSESRAHEVKRVLNEPIEFTARRRKDIDFIAMLALPNQAKQLKPGLAFYFAADIPLYSTSHIFSPANARYKKNSDLDGIQFCDIPWILGPRSAIHQNLNSAWSNHNKHLERLYALGADAFHLATWLPIMQTAPDIWILGQTGSLRLLSDQQIERSLPWAIMKNGQASATTPPILEIQLPNENSSSEKTQPFSEKRAEI